MIKKEERVEGPKEEKKEEKKKGSGIFPIPKILSKIIKKEDKDVGKDKIPEIEKKANDLEEQVAPVKEKVDALGKEVTELKGKVNDHDKDIKGIKDQFAEFKTELAKCVRFYMFWIVFALLGIVGFVYLARNFEFKEVTWTSYVVGIFGTAVIATLYYLYYKKQRK